MHPNETRIFIAILSGVFVLALLMVFFIATIIRYQKKKVLLYSERIKAEINSLEKERSRIASDLHDDLGATLSAIKLRLQCIDTTHLKDALLIEKTETYIDDAMQKLRQISFNMMPRILESKGLREALDELIGMLNYANGLRINYTCSVQLPDSETRIHIYRIIQEIMHNITRHAKATDVVLRIEKAEGNIVLHIQDNGTGFDKNTAFKSPGQGLQNIVARADLLKARIYLVTEPGKGVDYLIKIPISDAN